MPTTIPARLAWPGLRVFVGGQEQQVTKVIPTYAVAGGQPGVPDICLAGTTLPIVRPDHPLTVHYEPEE